MNPIQINLLEPEVAQPVEKIKPLKDHFFLLVAVVQIDGGLAFGGFEWHEKYIAKMTNYCEDQTILLNALCKSHQFEKGRIAETGSGKRIVMQNCQIWFAQHKLAPTLSKLIIEQKILPVINIDKLIQVAA